MQQVIIHSSRDFDFKEYTQLLGVKNLVLGISPEVQTMLNGKPLGKWGEVINPGDTISFGDVTISVL